MKKFILTLILLVSCYSYSKSSEIVRRDHVLVSLISELNQVKPNENFYIGFKVTLQKGWHIYWKNPGDSGTAPRVKWTPMEDISIGHFDWPAPQKISVDPLANYGYEDEVILPMIVSVSSVSEKSVVMQGNFEWLVCRVECVPGSATLKLEIPFGDKNVESVYASQIQTYLNKVPKQIHDIKSSFHQINDQIVLNFNIPKNVEDAYFFPSEGTSLNHAAPQSFSKNEKGSYQLTIPASETLTKPIAMLPGILQVTENSKKQFFQIDPKKSMQMPEKSEFLWAVVFAFLGGLILNLMPCVFPVIAIKILSLIEITKENPKSIIRHGWAYTLGVLISFMVLSALLLTLQALGSHLGWGFQLQSPQFVVSMILLFYFMGLNLYGLFDIDGAFVNVGGSLANQRNMVGTFFTGVLAVIVATPCTAPFMGTALGLTLTMPAYLSLVIYMALGFGMAFPYLILCYFPPLLRKLPKPGAWMKNLKQFLAFPMFLTSLWLIWVLSFQTTADYLITLLGILIFIFFLFWMSKILKLQTKIKSIILIIMGVASIVYLVKSIQSVKVQAAREELWKSYSPEIVEEAVKDKKKVFVNFTAAWCLTCQVNKKLVLNRTEVLNYFKQNNVVLFEADWTNQDPVITAELKKLGRNSVPVYLYYDASGTQNILPEILTTDIIYKQIK